MRTPKARGVTTDKLSKKPAKGARTGAAVARKASQTPGRSAPSKAAPQQPQGKTATPVLLSGGNPQIAKGYGDAPVEAYIAAMPGWKRAVGRRLDTLITGAVPGVAKAVKWNSPLYGVADPEENPQKGKGLQRSWFLSVHCFARYVKVAFFRGASLKPVPPGASKQKDVRYLDIHEHDELDEGQFIAWVKQASALPGERM